MSRGATEATAPSASSARPKTDRCPFSVSAGLVARELAGGRGSYRNHGALTKVEAQLRRLCGRFAHETVIDVAGKPRQSSTVCYFLKYRVLFGN